MKLFVFTFVMLFSFVGQAASSMCDTYSSTPRYFKALTAVATHQGVSMDEFCNSPNVLAIEAQPNRIFTREGEVIPHVRVELHFSYHSCSFLVRDADLAITKSHCYSTF